MKRAKIEIRIKAAPAKMAMEKKLSAYGASKRSSAGVPATRPMPNGPSPVKPNPSVI